MTKQEDIKLSLPTLLEDQRESGVNDGQAMFLLGSLAAGLADENQLLPRTDFAVVEPVVRETRVSFIFEEARERVAVIV